MIHDVIYNAFLRCEIRFRDIFTDIGSLRDRGNTATFMELDLFARNSWKLPIKWNNMENVQNKAEFAISHAKLSLFGQYSESGQLSTPISLMMS